MKNYFFLFICLFKLSLLGAQAKYFQQEVKYKIDVRLDDKLHRLSGEIRIDYTNHAPLALDTIWMHLWANAFQRKNTAFAKQQLNLGKQEFYFAKPDQLGGYSKLDFKVNDKKVEWQLDAQHPDIAYLLLPTALEPGQTLSISTPFELKIPEQFSRLGHTAQAYEITQWYPKPAVYDAEGWHVMPYLELGEFYAEFATFDVRISLPENYWVAATGILQTAAEQARIQKRVDETEAILKDGNQLEGKTPLSSETLKTIRYTAEQVQDFAWFANKDFLIRKSSVTLNNGKEVDTWAYFLANGAATWKDVPSFLNRAIQFYSQKVGSYPYPQATAVQGALEASDGMEYPMITLITEVENSQVLDIITAHEVGHNWFCIILGFNERAHPWMDEGLNSYYEERYTEQFYPNNQHLLLPEFLYKDSEMTDSELLYLIQARRNRDIAPSEFTPSISYLNYSLAAYQKPALAFAHLEGYVGQQKLDSLLQGFYEEWKFKHPQPHHLRQHLEQGVGDTLIWLFEGLLYSNKKLDYGFLSVQKEKKWQLNIQNHGEIAAPFSISAYRNGKRVKTKWFQGFQGSQILSFRGGKYDAFIIDAQRQMPDVDRSNNNIKTKGIFKTAEPIQFRFLAGVENEKRNTIYFTPTYAWNNYDEGMAGLALYNTVLPARGVEWSLAPMYSFKTKDVLGLSNLNIYAYPKTGKIERVKVGLGVKSFHFDQRSTNFGDYDLKYLRVSPSLQLDFQSKKGSNFKQYIGWRTLFLRQERANFMVTPSETQLEIDWFGRSIHQLQYGGQDKRALHPYSLEAILEYQDYTDAFGEEQYYLKASLETNYAYTYKTEKSVDIRIFVGAFLLNSLRNDTQPRDVFFGSFNLVSTGYNDYRYDDFYFGRNEIDGFSSQQIHLNEGGLKLPITAPNRRIQASNDYILALNLKADLPMDFPLNLPIKPYFDIAYYNDITPLGRGKNFSDQLLWSGGFMLDLFDGMMGVYFPLVNSDSLELDALFAERGNYWTRVTFNIDLERLNPWKALRNFEF